MEYSKKIFALLLERAKGERSWHAFAADCGISYVQMRKLAFCRQENPPRRKLLLKLAAGSGGDVSAEDFFCAAGVSEDRRLSAEEKALLKSFSSLKPRQRREVADFAAFLKKGGRA